MQGQVVALKAKAQFSGRHLVSVAIDEKSIGGCRVADEMLPLHRRPAPIDA